MNPEDLPLYGEGLFNKTDDIMEDIMKKNTAKHMSFIQHA